MDLESGTPLPELASLSPVQLTVRLLVHADLRALEWDGEFTHFRRLYAQAYRQAVLNRAVLWVADLVGAGVIGQVFVQLVSERKELADGRKRAYVYSFRVRAPYRGMGVGSRLLQVAERDLRERGLRLVTLNVGRDNPDARRFYERHGYRVIAPEPGRWQYIDHRGHLQTVHEPAWRMEKDLTAS